MRRFHSVKLTSYTTYTTFIFQADGKVVSPNSFQTQIEYISKERHSVLQYFELSRRLSFVKSKKAPKAFTTHVYA